MYLPIAVLGLGLISLLGYSSYTGIRMNTKYAHLDEIVMKIQLEGTRAHLLAEEIMSGNTGVEIKAIREHLDKVKIYTQLMLEGGTAPEGNLVIPLKDATLRGKLGKVVIKEAELRGILFLLLKTSGLCRPPWSSKFRPRLYSIKGSLNNLTFYSSFVFLL